LLFTGRVIDAGEAGRIGLVSRVVPHDELLPAAMELAGEIAASPPLAVQALKRGLRRALDPDWADLGAWVSSTLADLFRTEDHREGVAAFLEKREPRYVGR
jgi:enoyl-CoA hydratase